MDRRKPELLCPAGDMEKLRMAVAYGADAVYLAGTSFGMRSFTANFAPDELPQAIKLAHDAGVKVHCTVNIMPRNDEAAALPAYLEQLDAAGVDALILADLGAVDGVVGGVVEVVHIVGHGVSLGDIVVVAVLRRSHHVDLAEELGLLDGLVCPYAGVEICSLGFEQVEGHHGELQRGTAAEEEHVIPLGDLQKLFHKGLCLIHYCLKLLRAVRYLKNGETGIGEINHGIGRIFDGVGAQNRGPCVEIMLLHMKNL